MTTRFYDYQLTVSSGDDFIIGDIVVGTNSASIAEVVQKAGNTLKVRMSNLKDEFVTSEYLVSSKALSYSVNTFIDHTSNAANKVLSYSLPIFNIPSDYVEVYINSLPIDKTYYVVDTNNVTLLTNTAIISSNGDFIVSAVESFLIQAVSNNLNAYTYLSSNIYGYYESANSDILSISGSPYIAEKNSSLQSPIVKLYTIYYPGEWYPPTANGNPASTGEGFPWPNGFPLRYAEFYGDNTDLPATVLFDGVEYATTTINGGSLSVDSSGTIGSTNIEISNFDGNIGKLIENKNILGYNSSNSAQAIVNGELVTNIDPRTIQGNELFNAETYASKGANAVWDYESTISLGDTWVPLKSDSRDLLGAVVDIKLTYAKFLDYWPEYSTIKNIDNANVYVRSSAPYRIGDEVTSISANNSAIITNIDGNTLILDQELFASVQEKLFIKSTDSDTSAYTNYIFTLTNMQEMNDFSIKFNLTNWLQYFKMEVPKRKFFVSTCPWRYKGPECKYPANGSGNIEGSYPLLQSNGFFTINNATTLNVSEDICAKTYTACALRRNLTNFGGFPDAK